MGISHTPPFEPVKLMGMLLSSTVQLVFLLKCFCSHLLCIFYLDQPFSLNTFPKIPTIVTNQFYARRCDFGVFIPNNVCQNLIFRIIAFFSTTVIPNNFSSNVGLYFKVMLVLFFSIFMIVHFAPAFSAATRQPLATE